MPMNLPPGAVALGSHAYLFPSPAGAVADCLIVGHGGAVSIGSEGLDFSFTVPPGCTLHFMTSGGNPFSASGPVTGFKAIVAQNVGNPPPIGKGDTRNAGSTCTDYVLAKAHGTHWGHETMAEKDYVAIAAALNTLHGQFAALQWLPHYISIRNRHAFGTHRYVFLSKVIQDVINHDATITNFYLMHCRGAVSDEKSRKILKNVTGQAFQQ